MKVSSAFPSKWLKADDLKGRRIKVIIGKIDMEDIGDEEKLVMYFDGKDKGMILNRTNAGRCEIGFGSDETEDWIGKEVILQAEPVQFQGKTVMGLRLEIPKPEPIEVGAEEEPPF